MTASDEIRDFLTSRRARITPEQAGLPAYGTHRRALHLDEAERTHLYNLVRAAGGTGPRRQVARRPSRAVVRRPLQLILDTMTGTPADFFSTWIAWSPMPDQRVHRRA